MAEQLADEALADHETELLKPELVMYELQADGAMVLVGVDCIIPFATWKSPQPPVLLGQPFTRNEPLKVWALHVWRPRENPSGLFAAWSPTVSCQHANQYAGGEPADAGRRGRAKVGEGTCRYLLLRASVPMWGGAPAMHPLTQARIVMSSLRNAGRAPLLARRIASTLGIAAVMAVAGLTACADAPTAPSAPATPAASASLVSSLGSLTGTLTGTLTTTTSTLVSTTTSLTGTLVHGLLWTAPAGETSASRVIGPAGGTLSIPNGVRIVVPRGAVSRNVTFSVTRLPGIIVAYDFQPHGIKFAVPVQIEQPTDGTGLLDLLRSNRSTTVRGAYFPDRSLLDQLLGTARVTEFRPASISADRKWIRFTADHFSGYMVSTD